MTQPGINNHPIRTHRNRSTFLVVSWLLAASLAACTQGETQSPTPPPSHTANPTATSAPTSAPPPTQTPVPTATPAPTQAPSRTPTRTRGPTVTSGPTMTGTPAGSGQVGSCPGAPAISLKLGDWAMVSMDPPLANKVRSQPGSSGEQIGQIQPGENVLVVDGPRCAEGYNWWLVRNLDGLEGWTAEGDATGYWLVKPISAWNPLPGPLTAQGAQTYALRELSISADTVLVSGITGAYFPLATPLPRPETIETPEPDDPRFSDFGTTEYAAHSNYAIAGRLNVYFGVFDLEDPLSRYYLNHRSYDDCTQVLRKNLEGAEIVAANLDPFCGINGGIPLHFIVAVKPVQFTGGKGVRFLIASANYQTVNHLEYVFQGLSDDGRYFIRGLFRPITHPYMLEGAVLLEDFGPLLAWKEGQYEEAQQSYDEFNARIEKMLNAGVVTLYPSLDLLDAMMASIVIK